MTGVQTCALPISAEKLEAATKKCMKITVNDTRPMCLVLDQIGVEYRVVSLTEAELYGNITVTTLVHALDTVGCEVVAMREKNEGLETYYLNLVGGGSDA